MDITYRPYIRDSIFDDLSIKKPTINIRGYKPKYTAYEPEEDTAVPVESQIEEIRTPTKPIKSKSNNTKFKSKKEFKQVMTPIYETILTKKGINPVFAKALVAQDGLESAWGSKPSGRFNFGGIKGKGTVKRTREVINGKDTYINDSFRDFDSLEDYVNYKIDLLNNNRYKVFSGDISEFADRVHRGGYATDPNYSRVLNDIIASAKHGGVLKFQEGGINQAKEWVKNWYVNRRPHIKRNIQQNQRFPFPVTEAIGYNVLTKNMNLTTAKVNPDKVPEGASGVYYPRGRKIYLKEDSPTSAVHEWVHGSRPDAQVREISKIKNILKDNIYDQKSVIPNNYLDNPEEVYARLMQLRYILGVDPNHVFTNEEIEALKKNNIQYQTLNNRVEGKNSKGFSTTVFDKEGNVIQAEPFNPEYKSNPEESTSHIEYNKEDTFDVLNRYSTDFIRRLLNDVAQIPNKKKDSTLFVKLGLKIPKFQNPSGTIKKTSEPWQVWSEHLKPESTDPNWRAPLIKEIPIKKEKYQVKRKYDKEARSQSGDRYYDIVKSRTKDAYDALIRRGVSKEVAEILQEPLGVVSIKETGWVLKDPNNNYWGHLIDGKKKAYYETKEASLDSWIKNLNDLYGESNLRGPWWEATTVEDFVNRINNPDLDYKLHSQKDYDLYNKELKKQGIGHQYMHAPYWNNSGKHFNDEVRDIIDRYYGYYYME